jgi:hypothetical protein
MKKSRLLGAVCAAAITLLSTMANAAVLPLEGRLETALGSGVFLAYYDPNLDITWLADANAGAGSAFDDELSPTDGVMTWTNANAWAASLTVGGVSGWRLPTVRPVDGSAFDIFFSNNASTDQGYAPTTTDGTDGGWRDGSNTPVSEMGFLYYVTLGNIGRCASDNSNPSGCTEPTSWGLSNTGPFSNFQSSLYWFGAEEFALDPTSALYFNFVLGFQGLTPKHAGLFAWAVHSGDVPAVVPIPAAVWLFGSGLLGLIGIVRRKKA